MDLPLERRRRDAIKYVLDAVEALAPGSLDANKSFITSEKALLQLCVSWTEQILHPHGEAPTGLLETLKESLTNMEINV